MTAVHSVINLHFTRTGQVLSFEAEIPMTRKHVDNACEIAGVEYGVSGGGVGEREYDFLFDNDDIHDAGYKIGKLLLELNAEQEALLNE